MYNIYDCENSYICSIAKENAKGNTILEVLKEAGFIVKKGEEKNND